MDSIFTKQDQKTIIFLIIAALMGTGVLLIKNELKPKTSFPVQKKEITYKNIQKFPIDINKATKEELISVKGIGPKLAERIISYREDNKKFSSLEELKLVKGIGEKTFNKFKKYLICDQKK